MEVRRPAEIVVEYLFVYNARKNRKMAQIFSIIFSVLLEWGVIPSTRPA